MKTKLVNFRIKFRLPALFTSDYTALFRYKYCTMIISSAFKSKIVDDAKRSGEFALTFVGRIPWLLDKMSLNLLFFMSVRN